MNRTALLALLAGVSVRFADAGMPPSSPSEWNPCTITTTLPPSQVLTQAPRVTLTLDKHDKFVKAGQQTTSAVSPYQPALSPARPPHTSTSVISVSESKVPISTALAEALSTLANTLPSSILKTAPLDAIGAETSTQVHTQETQQHSVMTFFTQTRKEASPTASDLEGDHNIYPDSSVIGDWAVATSLGATTPAPVTLEVIALSSSTPILQDASNPTTSLSIQPFQTQVSAAGSRGVIYSWKSVLSCIIIVSFLEI